MVTVIVPTLGAGEMLAGAVRPLMQLDGAEVVLVDNGSRDGSVQSVAAAFPSVRVIRPGSNLGYARACNVGAEAADGRYLLFLNDDAEPTPDALRSLIAIADDDPAGAVWQPVLVGRDGVVESSGELFTRSGFTRHLTDRPRTVRRAFHALGACMLVRKSVFDELGGFEESYFAYSEDVDLCWRARLAGWEVRVHPATVVHHRNVTSRRVFLPHEVNYLTFRNRLRTIVANAGTFTLVTTVPVHLLGCLAAALVHLALGRPRSAWWIVRALAWPLRNIAEMRRQRRAAQALRVVPDRLIFSHEIVGRIGPVEGLTLLRDHLGRWVR